MNTLEAIINKLGGPSKVCEFTGRKGRVVYDPEEVNSRARYELRNEDSDDLINVHGKYTLIIYI